MLEVIWEELDAIMERLMTGQAAEDGKDPGRAEGIAYAIAVMNNPYLPSVDNVREQAMDRWEQAQAAAAAVPKPPVRDLAARKAARARRVNRG